MKPDIDEKLKAWSVNVDVPARFQAEVWERISMQRESRFAVAGWIQGWVAGWILKPQYATAILLAAVLIGFGTAQLEAQSVNSRNKETLKLRYFESIDPIAKSQAGE